MYRNTYALINKKDIENNVKEILNKYNNYKYYIGVVKANAYSHGIEIVESLITSGINYLAVSSLDEAIELRKYYKEIPILVLETVNIKYIDVCINNNITITLENYEYFNELKRSHVKGKLLIHLKIDSGMNRLGLKNKEQINEIVNYIKGSTNLILEGVYTHLATSGIFDKHYLSQLTKFRELTSDIDLASIPMVHIGKSTTLVTKDKPDFVNSIRLGIIMFGYNPAVKVGTDFRSKLRMMKRNYLIKKYVLTPSYLSNDLNLTKSFKLYTEIMSIKHVQKGEFIGYGADYKVSENSIIGILPIGFADGIKGIKFVSINNKRYPVISNMCMDMTFIKIDESVNLYDKVEIFGDNINVHQVTSSLGINAYQLLSRITSRVERKYIDE